MRKQHANTRVTTVVVLLSFLIVSATAGSDTTSLQKNRFCFQGGGGIGGAGGIAPSLQWLDLSPVEDVVKKETDLRQYPFDFKDNGFMLIGGMGYGGTRCGASIGGGGWFGYKKFQSASRTVPLQDSLGNIIFSKGDTVKVDSAAQLHTMIAYGGFLAEKNFSISNFTLSIGGLFGGGALILGKEFVSTENSSAFTTTKEFDSSDIAGSWTAAPLFCFDIHSGISWRISPFMLIGADANLLIFTSNSGFNYNTDSFMTVNPGIRLRVLFGNLG